MDGRQRREWHEAAYQALRERPSGRVSYLGLELDVPRGVFPPTPVSDLLGSAVLDEVAEQDRVLDMGTGCGVNAILAASRSSDVVGVDINPRAVAAAHANAERNAVAHRTSFEVSDVFDAVQGTFDLMVIDPPFRSFAARDEIEAAITDEGYGALARFLGGAALRLRPGGRILLFFGTSGDLDHVLDLAAEAGFATQRMATRDQDRDGTRVTYVTYRLSIPA